MKLKQRLYVILLAVSLIPLFLCGLVMMYQNRTNVEKVVKQNLLGVSLYQIDTIGTFCDQVKQNMNLIAKQSVVQDEILVNLGRKEATGESAHFYLDDMLEERKDYLSYVQSVFIVDKNLHTVSASETYLKGLPSGLSTAKPDFLDGHFCFGDVYSRVIDGNIVRMVMAYQGVFCEGELIGYVVEEIRTEYFSKYHRENALWEHATMQILDGRNQVVTIGGDGEEDEDFLDSQTIHNQKVERWQKKEGYETSGSMDYSVSGVKYMTCYADILYTDWTIRITVNVNEYQDDELSYLAIFVTVIIMGTLLLTVLNYFLTVRTVLPIERMRRTLQKIQATQDYSIRIETGTDDEVGELEHEINHLLQCFMEGQMQGMEEQKSLEKKAEKDPMTGIMNKKAIARYVQLLDEEVEARDGRIAVGFVDIDDFRDYNTLYGHAEGDHVIKFVAHTLRETIPGYVGRNGGDEFVFCMETDGREIVEQIMERLERKLKKGVINSVTNQEMPIPCSIGVVVDRAGKTDYRKLIQEADEAMYQAKGKGKNTYHVTMK